MEKHIFQLLPQDKDAEDSLQKEFSLSPLAARTLVSRGLKDPVTVERFLHPSLARDWKDPFKLNGMGDAAERVLEGITNHERIVIYGDFDVDGISASALLSLYLASCGADVSVYIPDRFSEGYGLSLAALEKVCERYKPDLLVTVDNGISAKNEVQWLLEKGIDVVVTDHHNPDKNVPQGIPLVDPKTDSQGPSQNLSGAGVALKLVQAIEALREEDKNDSGATDEPLTQQSGKDPQWISFCDLATLGTIADVMELDFENRALVTKGISQMKRTVRPGLVALFNALKIEPKEIEANDLPFSVIPRLNAAGRMGKVEVAYDLLVTSEVNKAEIFAGRIQALNDERRRLEAEVQQKAFAEGKKELQKDPNLSVLVLAGTDWFEGVKGIVAARLAHAFQLPVILISFTNGTGKGSGRSIGEVDLFQAVSSCSDFLEKFGGHKGAVGISIKEENLEAFRKQLNDVLKKVPSDEFVEKTEVVGEAILEELTIANISSLNLLRPFGRGNSYPLFLTREVSFNDVHLIGAQKNHIAATVTTPHSPALIRGVLFNPAHPENYLGGHGLFDAYFEPIVNVWRSKQTPQIRIRALEEVELLTYTERLRKAFIGENKLLPIQAEALENLAASKNTLAIMTTGRGKSLIFQIHAARLALAKKEVSIFVFPLRALVNDQAFHLQESLAQFNLRTEILTGETDPEQREEIYECLRAGDIDIILTTPEFLSIHADKFAEAASIGFVVIDEAHHAGDSKGGNRFSYLDFPRVLKMLGDPVVLAVSATINNRQADELKHLFSLGAVITDTTSRDNLKLIDARNVDKDERSILEKIDDESELSLRQKELIDLLSRGEKTIVYVNSRGQTISLAKLLRRYLPDLAPRIAFYNAGLTKQERKEVEKEFRRNRLVAIVSTSAFGEGVNIPDIRHVVLYHLPFGETEFNQMSGRAGRDGKEAFIHLLFGEKDASINEGILENVSPSREALAALFKTILVMEKMQDETPARILHASNAEIGSYAAYLQEGTPLDEALVAAGLSIFKELGILTVSGMGEQRTIKFLSKVDDFFDLGDSIIYTEGLREKESFLSFKEWVLEAESATLLNRITHPIVPC